MSVFVYVLTKKAQTTLLQTLIYDPRIRACVVRNIISVHSDNRHTIYMRISRKFCQRGSRFFLVDEGIEDANSTINGGINGSPVKRHLNLNGVSLAGR